ncbi:esterase/lipase family protein [Nitrospira sp. NS4]|uniref:esterase/lipase family protein n=1 Tax=Nitrospira sp. NS4 TaxID=3414498 RepID=UPI003C2C25A2
MGDSAFKPGQYRAAHMGIWIIACLILTGCVFQGVRDQQRKIEDRCVIGGTVTTEHDSANPILVGLMRHTGGEIESPQNWALVDHFVLESAGRWMFHAGPSTYGLVAFEDSNADGIYQPGEPFLNVDAKRLLTCQRGDRKNDVALVIPTQRRSRLEGEINFDTLQARTSSEQVRASLGLATAYGEVVTLDDPRFREEQATNSLWRPYDFIFDVHPGVYFLQPYDAGKIPVLFVHGINGTPSNFRSLIERLDRSRYQPWVYYYPSGARLAVVSDHLDQIMKHLQLQHGFRRYYVVAHSMGGLVSRGFLLRNQTGGSRARIPLYITISTPWAGHKAAESGVKYSPAVVGVWNDMAPGSAYLTDLFFQEGGGAPVHRPLPAGVRHHLLFGYKPGGSPVGECTDSTVTLASELYPGAQEDANRLYGFDETHMGILDSVETSRVVNRLLDEASR